MKATIATQVAIYPGSFDPITNGHVDIICRASRLFEKVIVAVAPSLQKAPYFSLGERITLVEQTFFDQKNIEIKPLNGLLAKFVDVHHAGFIVRGLRSLSDFDHEFQLFTMNTQIAPNIETVFLMSSSKNRGVSSSLVREMLALHADISMFVPKPVNQMLIERRISSTLHK